MGSLEQNTQELQETSPADSPRTGLQENFGLSEAAAALGLTRQALQKNFTAAAAANDIPLMRETRATLQSLEKDILRLMVDVNAALLDNDLKSMREMIGRIDEDGIGASFLALEKEARCTIAIDRSLGKDANAPLATYQSYSYEQGLIDEILINEFKLSGDIFSLTNNVEHELFHRFQAMSAPALYHNHANRDTRILIHPEDWMHLENICERDAYTKQAMMNHLLGKTHAQAKARSKFDIVSVHEFEDYRSIFATLQETLVHASLNALYKPVKENDYSRFFYQHYQEGALDRYATSMGKRKNNGETDFTFVRLEPADFWAVGAYGVGPNSLGEHHLDPGFLKRMEMGEDVRRKLKLLCEQNGIPTLEDCLTLAEATRETPIPAADRIVTRGGTMPLQTLHAPSFL